MRQIALLVCLLLSACQTTGPLNENSHSDVPPPGSRLVLKQELTIPAHSAGVLLQGGRVVSDKDLNPYYPHCRLEVHDVRETMQTVLADEFVVRRALRMETYTAMRSGLLKAGWRSAGDPSFLIYRISMDLHSPRQPQVRWLDCQQWGDPAVGQHLSIREIRLALGEIFLLQLPASAPDDRR